MTSTREHRAAWLDHLLVQRQNSPRARDGFGLVYRYLVAAPSAEDLVDDPGSRRLEDLTLSGPPRDPKVRVSTNRASSTSQRFEIPMDFGGKVFSDHSAHEQPIGPVGDRVAIDALLHLDPAVHEWI